MADNTTADQNDEVESDLVQWLDEDGRQHTGSRYGEGYRLHQQKEAKKAKAEAAAKAKAEADAKAAETAEPGNAAEAPAPAAAGAASAAEAAAAAAPVETPETAKPTRSGRK
ncbi:hypothetical protein [Gordonia malaquae]|uniref:hypothetical protein n=1 Tax=Gordonia malaquae TaxID=410332 RepID=UPI003015D539